MTQRPVVLVFTKNPKVLDVLVRDLKAYDLAAFGTQSVEEGRRIFELLNPEVVVIDPTSAECFDLLQDLNRGGDGFGIVAIAESERTVQLAREMGIEEIVMGDDIAAVVDAVFDLLGEEPAPPPPAAGPAILVVDDESELVDILSSMLKRRGYLVAAAGSGSEALETVERDPAIRLVLLDVIMPGGGGMETLKELKDRHPHLTVILMSAIADAEIAHHAVRLGAFDYVVKPIDLDELEGRIIAGLAAEEFHLQRWWRRFTAR